MVTWDHTITMNDNKNMEDITYISLGQTCQPRLRINAIDGISNASVPWYRHDGKGWSFPFDWTISTPVSNLKLLNTIVNSNKPVEEIVSTEFLPQNRLRFLINMGSLIRAGEEKAEDQKTGQHYEFKPLHIIKKLELVSHLAYGVPSTKTIFPHEGFHEIGNLLTDSGSHRELIVKKYTRRFERLKDLILNRKKIIFILYILTDNGYHFQNVSVPIWNDEIQREFNHEFSELYSINNNMNVCISGPGFHQVAEEDLHDSIFKLGWGDLENIKYRE